MVARRIINNHTELNNVGELTHEEIDNAISGSSFLVISGTDSLSSARSINNGTGLSSSDGGAGGNYTLSIDDSVVATLSGSHFDGSISVVGTGSFENGLTGSLTKLTDGSSYLEAGDNITITTQSNGSVRFTVPAAGGGGSGDPNASYVVLGTTGSLSSERVLANAGGITITDGGAGNSVSLSVSKPFDDDASYVVLSSTGSLNNEEVLTAGTGLDLSTATLSVDDSIVATLSGSHFDGDITIVGTGSFENGLTGSLTNLIDGTSYLEAGSNMTITTQSNGSVLLTSTDTQGKPFDDQASYIVISATGSLDNERVLSNAGGITITDGGAGGSVSLSVSKPFDDDASYVVLSSTGSLNNEEVLTAGTGLDLSTATLSVDDSVVATLSGSHFDGSISVVGTGSFENGLTGSLTNLTDGSSYLEAGSNMTITTQSNGSVLLASTDTQGKPFDDQASYIVLSSTGSLDNERVLSNAGGITIADGGAGNSVSLSVSKPFDDDASYVVLSSTGSLNNEEVLTAGTGLDLSTATLSVDDSVVATLSGSKFQGNVEITGTLGVSNEAILYGETSIGEPGNEQGNILYSGSSFDAILKVNDFGGGRDALGILHRHSTVDSANLLFSLSNTNDASHSSISAGRRIGRVLFAADAGNDEYIPASSIDISADSNGTVNSASMPGHFSLKLSPDGTAFPKERLSIRSDGLTAFSGSVEFVEGLSGSLTNLTDGSSYLEAGSNMTITTQSNGSVLLTSTGGAGGSGPTFDDDASYLVLSTTGSLNNERAFVAGSGMNADDSGANGNYTLSVDDSVVATLSGSHFDGSITVVGTGSFQGGLTVGTGSEDLVMHINKGSTTNRNTYFRMYGGNGSSEEYGEFGINGDNPAINIPNSSTAAFSINSHAGSNLVSVDGQNIITTIRRNLVVRNSGNRIMMNLKNSDELQFGNTSDNNTFTKFGSGLVIMSGSSEFPDGVSGSLTNLTDGTSFLEAGSNMTITTQSNGSILLATGDNPGDIHVYTDSYLGAYSTFGEALDVASASAPTAASPAVVSTISSARYDESIVVPANVFVDAPLASIESNSGSTVIVGQNSRVSFREIICNATSSVAVGRSNTSGVGRVFADVITLNSGSGAVLNFTNAGAVLFIRVESLFVNADNAFGIGDLNSTSGHIHFRVGDLYLGANGTTGISRGGTGTTIGTIEHLLELGPITGTTGFKATNGEINANALLVSTEKACDISTNGTLNAFINSLSGSQDGAGTINITTP